MSAPERLDGRVAVVTGGNRGIGRAVSERLAGDGATVAIVYRRDADAARDAVATIEKNGGRATAHQASVDVLDQCRAMVDDVITAHGYVDIIVSSAGIASRGHTVADTDPDEMERVVRTHAFGAFYLCHLLVPQMRERPRGDVVVVSSVAAQRAMPGGAPYMMGKVALEALAQTLALEEMPHGIHTNIVEPGLVVTDMGDRLARAVAGVSDAAELDARAPYGRVCRPEDVANVVAYLVSERASYLNGQRIAVDGGGSPFA